MIRDAPKLATFLQTLNGRAGIRYLYYLLPLILFYGRTTVPQVVLPLTLV